MKSERSEHTRQPTVLVNEFYLELLKIKALPAADSAGHERKYCRCSPGWLIKSPTLAA